MRRHRLIHRWPEQHGARHRCATDRHEPVTHNPIQGRTYCRCGHISRPGNVARYATPHEAREAFPWHTPSMTEAA